MDPFSDIKNWSDVNQIENFLKTHNVNTIDIMRRTPLHWASRYGHTEIVKFLISRRANVDAKTNGGDTPLHYASEYGHIEIVEVLIEKGADVNARKICVDELTPLHMASDKGHTEIVQILIDHGAKVNPIYDRKWAPLHTASCGGHTKIVQILISNGANVDAKANWGDIPLYFASRHGHTEVVKVLIEHGANAMPVVLDNSIQNHTKVVKLLLNSQGIKLKKYKNIINIEKTLDKRKINMINKLKIIQTACVGPEILEFIGEYLYPDISVHERLSIINDI